jgi:hypothetical protein
VEKWQFNVIFVVGIAGTIVLLIGPDIGLENVQSPGAVGGVGAIMTYILTQRDRLIKNGKNGHNKKGEDDENKH